MTRTFEKNGVRREAKEGFAWTVLFFGVIALAIRGQIGFAFVTIVTAGLAAFYYMFTANRLLIEQYQIDGWIEK